MFRNIVRTSRWLARRQINSLTPVKLCRITCVRSMNSHCYLPKIRKFSASADDPQSEHIEQAVFEEICNETLESLSDYFEELTEEAPNLRGADVQYTDGVLTIAFGSTFGTYVINRQTPNKQIWLSSPTSGPKRYDLVLKDGGYWVYKHDGMTLHDLLQREISKIVKTKVDFSKCAHSIL